MDGADADVEHADGLVLAALARMDFRHLTRLGGALMTTLPPLLEAFFIERLISQRRVSPHTVAAYRDMFSLLLRLLSALPAGRRIN